MKADGKDLFQTLDPPAGGAERLRARLQAERPRPMMSPVRLGLAAIAASALLTAILITQRPEVGNEIARDDIGLADDIFESPAFDRLLGREFQPVAMRVTLNDEPMQATAVASENPNIRMYDLRRMN